MRGIGQAAAVLFAVLLASCPLAAFGQDAAEGGAAGEAAAPPEAPVAGAPEAAEPPPEPEPVAANGALDGATPAAAEDQGAAAEDRSAEVASDGLETTAAPGASAGDAEQGAGSRRGGGARSPAWYRGRLNLRYDFRSNDGKNREDDQDFSQDLVFEAGYGRHARLETAFRLRQDVDGRGTPSLFAGISDTRDHAATAYLYTAYAELLDIGALGRLRAGRQYLAEGLEIRFDGALVESAVLGDAVRVFAYGGVPVHLYEASPTRDWLAGAGIELVALPRTSVRFDYLHLTDDRDDLDRQQNEDFVARDVNRDDDLFQLTVTHVLTPEIRLLARASTFEGRSSRFEGDVLYLDPLLDLTLRLRYVAQLGRYDDLSIQFSPLDQVLDAYAPYHEVHVFARKGIGDLFAVGGGVTIRELQDDREDESAFNHEFQRYFALFEIHSLPWKGLDVTLVADWFVSGVEDRSFQGTADVRQEVGPIAASVGTSYSLYSFDEFFIEERERVRTYYARLEWDACRSARVRMGYQFQEDDEERYHVVRCDVRLAF